MMTLAQFVGVDRFPLRCYHDGRDFRPWSYVVCRDSGRAYNYPNPVVDMFAQMAGRSSFDKSAIFFQACYREGFAKYPKTSTTNALRKLHNKTDPAATLAHWPASCKHHTFIDWIEWSPSIKAEGRLLHLLSQAVGAFFEKHRVEVVLPVRGEP